MSRNWIFAVAVLLAACGTRRAPPTILAAVQILSPADGDIVDSNPLIHLGVTDERVVPANGIRTEGEGHFHLFVDVDLTPADSAVPKSGGIYHLGSGADTLRLEGMTPGTHRIIGLFAYGDHVPMPNVGTDTIFIVVR